ncbi:MAG: tetratricopeptide repeat protein [Deltaproteobacteria bacterium]|nr:tetratricopeptide repeat protein [Deltaproteobacteria bacterium]
MESPQSRRGSSPQRQTLCLALRWWRTRRTSGYLSVCLLLGLGWITTACSTAFTDADRAFEAKSFPQAAQAYEAYLASNPSSPHKAKILFRLALMYLSPESKAHDPEAARSTFDRLVEEDPGSPFASLVAYAFYLERRVGELSREMEKSQEMVATLRRDLAVATDAQARAEAEKQARDEQLAVRGRQLEELTDTLEGLRTEVQDRKQQMRHLTEALELLKQIDLKR